MSTSIALRLPVLSGLDLVVNHLRNQQLATMTRKSSLQCILTCLASATLRAMICTMALRSSRLSGLDLVVNHLENKQLAPNWRTVQTRTSKVTGLPPSTCPPRRGRLAPLGMHRKRGAVPYGWTYTLSIVPCMASALTTVILTRPSLGTCTAYAPTIS